MDQTCLKELKSMTSIEKKAFINSFDTIITDCDGVLWWGPKVIKRAVDTINTYKTFKAVYFLTNSSTKTTEQLLKKFRSLGFNAEVDEVLGTAMLTAEYLRSMGISKKVYLVAPVAVKSELEAIGINSVGCGPDVMPIEGFKEQFFLEPDVDAVVVGFDIHFSYPKLAKATAYLTRANHIPFLATNPDNKLPKRGGGFEPGSGSFIKAIESSSGRKATIVGKPSKFAFEYVSSLRPQDPKRVLMIGDRCDTDIEFGRKLGMQTLLVLTGHNKLDDVKEYKASGMYHLVPHYYTNSIADLLDLLTPAQYNSTENFKR